MTCLSQEHPGTLWKGAAWGQVDIVPMGGVSHWSPSLEEGQPWRKGCRASHSTQHISGSQGGADAAGARAAQTIIYSLKLCSGKFTPFFLVVELSGKGSLFSQMYSLSKIIWGPT